MRYAAVGLIKTAKMNKKRRRRCDCSILALIKPTWQWIGLMLLWQTTGQEGWLLLLGLYRRIEGGCSEVAAGLDAANRERKSVSAAADQTGLDRAGLDWAGLVGLFDADAASKSPLNGEATELLLWSSTKKPPSSTSPHQSIKVQRFIVCSSRDQNRTYQNPPPNQPPQWLSRALAIGMTRPFPPPIPVIQGHASRAMLPTSTSPA